MFARPLSRPLADPARDLAAGPDGRLERRALGVCLAALLLTLVPIGILGQDSVFTVHDSLDGVVPMRVAAARDTSYFGVQAKVESIANGLPRTCLPPALNLTNMLYLVLEPFPAFVVNHMLVHLVALLGMYALLRRRSPASGPWVNCGVALGFALLPFYTVFSLSVAGQPFVLYALLAFLDRSWRRTHVLILCAFPFCSSLVLVGVFVLCCAGAMFAVDWARRRRPNLALAGVIAGMALGYGLAEYQTVLSLLRPDFISHRTEWDFTLASSFRECLQATLANLLSGQYHAASLHQPIVGLALPTGMLILAVARDWRTGRTLALLVGCCLLFSLAMGFQRWAALVPLKQVLPPLRYFQLGRFHWLHPCLWYFVLAVAAGVPMACGVGPRLMARGIAGVLVVGQLLWVGWNNPELTGTFGALFDRITNRETARMSYARFYAPALFQRVGQAIGKPKDSYRVVSLGLHPGIALYNGYRTLDFYSPSYPLSYKRSFRRLMAAELAKNAVQREYFDGWGSRCYVFSSELRGFMYTKEMQARVMDLAFDTRVLQELGGTYVFSAVEIVNHAAIGLRFEGAFEDAHGAWRIHLYRVALPASNI